MRKRILMTLIAAAALPLFAATDSLWEAAEERAWRSRDLVAGVITTRTEIADGDGQTLEIIDETERLTGWDAGKPVRKSDSKHTVVHKSGVSVKFNLSSGSNVFIAAREGRVTRTFLRDETLNGRRCAVYRVEERPPPGKPDKAVAGEVWIDRLAAIPVQGVYQPVTLPSNVKSYRMTITYALTGEHWAPTHARIEAAGGMMFVKRKLKVEKHFSGWLAP
jgi:hypothetical protein